MNVAEFSHLETIGSAIESVSIADLDNLTNRTLLYGYTCKRETWHVFLFEREIHRLVYDETETPDRPVIVTRDHAVTWRRSKDLIPDKRLYSEACDFEFCALLKKRGLILPFTKFSAKRKPRQFHGLI
jgi:hypothetical protein